MSGAAERVQSIQILRGIAALLVVCNHAIVVQAHFPDAMTGAFAPAMPALRNAGATGVDLFFVISGFVMAHSIAASHRTQTAADFLRNRAIRILPLFWLLSAAFALRQWSLGAGFPAAAYANSITLLPLLDGTPYQLPVLDVGWTLGFEFAFYLMVAAVLAMRRPRAVETLLAVACTFALVGLLPHADQPLLCFLANPIFGEFALGVAVWLLWRRGLPPVLAGGLVALGVALLMLSLVIDIGMRFPVHAHFVVTGSSSLHRVLLWGLPWAMVVAGVVCGKAPDNGRLSSWLIALGGASYSLYLVHPFVIAEARVWGPRGYVSDPYAAAGLLVVASLIAALLVYRWVEQPLIALIRRGFTPQMRPATAADEEPRPVPVSA